MSAQQHIEEGKIGRQQMQECINMRRKAIAQWQELHGKFASLPDQDEPDMQKALATFVELIEYEESMIAEYRDSYTKTLVLEFKLLMNEERYAATKFLGDLEVMACKTAYDCALNHMMLSRIINNISE